MRSLATQSCATSGTAAAVHTAHPAISFAFCTTKLPPHLQREFDVEANQRTLRHLLSRAQDRWAASGRQGACCETSHTCGEKKSGVPWGNTVELEVLPDWAHLVSWKCAVCDTQWTARPVDRLNNQLAEAHSCPLCRTRHVRPRDDETSVRTFLSSAITDDTASKDEKEQGYGSMLLITRYPALAAQWDTVRNAVPQNRVMQTLQTVKVSSGSLVWWRCLRCRRAWRESVRGCVARYEAQRGPLATDNAGTVTLKREADWLVLCPSCTTRGTVGRHAAISGGDDDEATTAAVSPRPARVLAGDALLMSEVRLQPHQDPYTISLQSEVRLSWHCRYCQYDFLASVADRHVRYARCPRCTGHVRSELNLLTIQRPDVVREVADTVSPRTLSYLTVTADTELPFICRVCLSPYRMSVRTRCTVPRGAVACPKCLLAQNHAARSATMQASRPLSRRQWRKVHESARQISRATRSWSRLELVRHDPCCRDKLLRN